MFEVTTRSAPIPTTVLHDGASGAVAEVTPTRGGMVTRLRVGDTPILSMDDASLYDLAKNVRGGIPVLFPIAGPLRDGKWVHDGKTYEMKQHGFARNLAWDVVGSESKERAALTLALRASDETRRMFPFDFEVRYTYALAGKRLRLELSYRNAGTVPMPLHTGFHPYFHVPDREKSKTTIATRATRAFDNVTKKDVAFPGFDLTVPEVDLHLHDHGSTETTIARPGGARIDIRASPEFVHWVVWTLAGKDFVCVEPWTAPGNALNSGDRLLQVAPGTARELWVEIGLG